MLSHGFSAPRQPSRVVILGAAGFVVGRLTRLLRSDGTSYRAIGSGEVDLVEAGAADKLRQIVKGDDALVITSALTPEKGRDRAAFLKNVSMIDSVCAFLAAAPCAQVIYISSDSVYDSRCKLINEECACESGDLYALAHIVREKLLADTCTNAGVRLAILRPSAIYGAADTHNSYGPNRFLRTALREGKITLFGQGEEERDHIYINDMARLISLCLWHGSSGVLNAVNGSALSFHEVASVIVRVLGREVAVETAPRRVRIIHRRFDTSALRSAFPGFQPTPFDAGIREVVAELAGGGNSEGLC